MVVQARKNFADQFGRRTTKMATIKPLRKDYDENCSNVLYKENHDEIPGHQQNYSFIELYDFKMREVLSVLYFDGVKFFAIAKQKRSTKNLNPRFFKNVSVKLRSS